jgi:hypothetical protein
MNATRLNRRTRAILAALAITLFAPLATGQDTIKVGNRTLQRTAFQIATRGIQGSCPGLCTAEAPVFVRTAQCDGAVGKTCTLYLHVDLQFNISQGDAGFFRFLIDGAAPTPGPNDGTGLNTFTFYSATGAEEARSFSVVGYVTNTKVNQQHTIQVNAGCFDNFNNGCMFQTDTGTLQTVVYTP